MRSLPVLLLCLLLGLTPAAAEEKPLRPPTPEQAADAVLAAAKAKDDTALASQAQRDVPDPWLVAEELCLRGERDAAKAYAKAARSPDTRALPAYVASTSRSARGTSLKAAEAAARQVGAAGKHTQALRLLASVDGSRPSVQSAGVLFTRARILESAARHADAAEAFRNSADVALRIGWLRHAAAAVFQSSRCHWRTGNYPGALTGLQEELTIQERRGHRLGVARAHGSTASLHGRRGRLDEAVASMQAARKVYASIKDHENVAWCDHEIAMFHRRRGAYDDAIKSFRSLLAYERGRGDTRGIASVLVKLGSIHHILGQYARALALTEESLDGYRKAGDMRGQSACLVNLGNTYQTLGDLDMALSLQLDALALKEKLADEAGMCLVLGNVGALNTKRGEYEEARTHLNLASMMAVERDDARALAAVLSSLGELAGLQGEHHEALDYHVRALAKAREVEDVWREVNTLLNISDAYRHLDKLKSSIATHREALLLAERHGMLGAQVKALWGLSSGRYKLGEHARAVALAHRGVDMLPLVVSGLGDAQGAQAREEWTGLLRTGALAAVDGHDVEDAAYFFESYRAGVLLESLGGRGAFAEVEIPAALLRAERAARAAERTARSIYGKAVGQAPLRTVRARRKALEAAQQRVLEVVARIQRTTKAAALVYPKAADLEVIQAALGADEALVLYLLLDTRAMALVVTRDRARIVPLGETAAIESIVDGLALETAGEETLTGLAALRERVILPLQLSARERRLVLAPHGALAYVPFAALVPDREVIYTPSGTTHVLLSKERSLRGSGILAIGDPAYGSGRRPAGSVLRSGTVLGHLTRLPATRREAQAIGTVVLLGSQATEAGFKRALARQPRWQAVHLACHGLADAENPMLSALALASDPENDGFLTCAEVIRLHIPADLVVLSACETGRGKVYKAEGIVGLTRAFMYAGAPRVLCSLWKVDDEATQALMIKFYELWRGKKGLGAAAALKQAQGYVRGHPKWEHPYYWAAWVLWGP